MDTNVPTSQYNFSRSPWMPVLCFGRTPLKMKRSLHFICRVQEENNTCCPEQQHIPRVPELGQPGLQREGGSPPLEGCHALVDSPTPMHYSIPMYVPFTLIRFSGLYFF